MMPHKLSSTVSQILNILNDGTIHTGIDIGRGGTYNSDRVLSYSL
jgi:hypothetical protein